MKFLTISVIASFAVCLVFTAVCIVLNCFGIEVSDTLIQWFYTVFGVEFAATAAIKISKHQIEKQATKERIDRIKEHGLPIEKEDLDAKDNDDIFEGGEYFG